MGANKCSKRPKRDEVSKTTTGGRVPKVGSPGAKGCSKQPRRDEVLETTMEGPEVRGWITGDQRMFKTAMKG